ncbi:cupin domain-containing protein [Jiulongibacter sediminis]|jgi:mannose-6-phosphate isomerase-like protein (cupin superfamily)/heme-degrading monooxygenase HmoA|uniref:cupin domain-containing protein n=1 Tax=Jiulongibacter sediminis TaxID=1605367 RepID=UPI0026E9E2D9|nr:cupin domain-containing protein [Jiulongibacter sediminis]
MKYLVSSLLTLFVIFSVKAQTLQERITHNDPADYRKLTSVHDGAGQMGFTELIGRYDLATNFLYLHSGTIDPKSGIGHHFHHTIEEMYVILDGEAEFTINGRTSKIKGPALVPCKRGDSHAIYNHTNKPLKWLNYAVSEVKGQGDAFDLGDTREGASLDATPTFVSASLEKKEIPATPPRFGPKPRSSHSLQVLGPQVFRTDWHHVDHLIIPVGEAIDSRTLEGFQEVYYVVNGSGTVSTNGQTTAFKTDDAFYGELGEDLSFKNTGNGDLQILVIGIAAAKESGLAIKQPLVKPKSMALQMDFVVEPANAEAFEKMYYSIYVPAMIVQDGYLSSKLLRLFPEEVAKGIEAEPTEYNYQIQIEFDTEENRREWVASDQHQIAWPAASGLAKKFKWRGYDVMGDDLR